MQLLPKMKMLPTAKSEVTNAVFVKIQEVANKSWRIVLIFVPESSYDLCPSMTMTCLVNVWTLDPVQWQQPLYGSPTFSRALCYLLNIKANIDHYFRIYISPHKFKLSACDEKWCGPWRSHPCTSTEAYNMPLEMNKRTKSSRRSLAFDVGQHQHT